jgi:hypothetical protein
MDLSGLFANDIVRTLLWPLYIFLVIFGPIFGLYY